MEIKFTIIFFLHFHDFQHTPNLTRTMERHKFNILWVDVYMARDRHESVSNMMQWNKVNEVEMLPSQIIKAKSSS